MRDVWRLRGFVVGLRRGTLWPGRSYGEAIIEAIHGAKVMVLVFSSSANASGHIPKEVERAVSNGVADASFSD